MNCVRCGAPCMTSTVGKHLNTAPICNRCRRNKGAYAYDERVRERKAVEKALTRKKP